MTAQSKVVAELIRGLKHERDELKLQMHLAGQELKDDLARLDDRLDALDSRYTPLRTAVGETADDVWDAMKLVASELRAGYQRVRAAL